MAIPSKEIADCMMDRCRRHAQFGMCPRGIVVLAYHKLAYIACRDLRGYTKAPEHIAPKTGQ